MSSSFFYCFWGITIYQIHSPHFHFCCRYWVVNGNCPWLPAMKRHIGENCSNAMAHPHVIPKVFYSLFMNFFVIFLNLRVCGVCWIVEIGRASCRERVECYVV